MRREILLNIDVAKAPVFNREFVVRNGDSLRLNVCMFEHGKVLRLDNQVIRTYVRKSDGSLLVQKEDIDIISENEFQVKLKNSATNVSGLCYMELEIQDPEDASVVIATNPILFEVEDRIGDVEDAIKAVDDIYLLGEIEKFIIQAKIDIALLKEQIEQGLVKINEFNEFIVQKSSELENKINDAISQIDKKTTDAKYELDVKSTECANYIKALGANYETSITNIGEQYLENMARKADEVIASIMGQKEDIDAYIEEKKDEVQDICDYNASLIEEKKNDALSEIASAKEDAVSDLDEFKNFVEDKTQEVQEICNFNASLIEEKKESALSEIESAKDDAIESITAEEAEILERISNIKIEGVEGVEEAVRIAQERLQEESIKQIWNIQEETANQLDSIEAKSISEQSNITKKADDEVKKIYDAGAEVFELVDGLDAQVEDGVNLINRTITKGQTDINTNANNQIERIREAGQNIIDAVNEQEQIAQGHIKDISDAGKSAKNMLESVAGSERAEIRKTATEQKESIIEVSASKLEEITGILGVTKGEAQQLLDTARDEINAHRESIDSKVESSLTQMEQAKDAHIDEIFNYEAELKEDFKAIKDEYVEEINTLGTSKVDALQKMIDDIDRLQERITDNLEEADNKAENLEKTLTNVDKKVEEIRPVIAMLDELRNICVALQQENQEANNNIDELQNLHIEADTRIVELRRLIDLAKHYEEVVQRYIDKKSGNHEEIEARLLALEEIITSLDLSVYATTEYVDEAISNIEIPSIEGLASENYVNNKIEEAVSNIEIPSIEGLASEEYVNSKIEDAISNIEVEVDLSDYATKEELSQSIEAFKEFKGNIGQAVKCATMPLNVYDNAPEAPIVNGEESIGKIMYRYKDGTSSDFYYLIYVYNNPAKNYYPYLHMQSTSSAHILRGYNISSSSSYHTARIYRRPYNGTNWAEQTSVSMDYIYLDYADVELYYHDMPVYTDVNKTGIYRQSTLSENIANFDNIVEVGNYYMDVTRNEYKTLQNAPNTDIKGDRVKAILKVYRKDSTVIQEITIEGITYSRIVGEEWITPDTSNYLTNQSIGKIEGVNANTFAYTNESVKAIFDKCPKFDNHHLEVKYIDFRYRDNNYCRIYTVREMDNPMFFMTQGASSGYIGFAGIWRNCKMYTNTGTGWVEKTQSYNIGYTTQYLEIYHNTLPICKASSSTSYDKSTILFEASTNEAEKVITDFNDANKYGVYNVEVAEGTLCANPPTNTAITGILEVVVVGERITQTLTTVNNTVYKRVLNDSWTQWKEEAEAEKIGLISTSEEEGAITDFDNAIECKIYEVYQIGWVLENAPVDAVIEGIMTVNETNRYITQSILDKHAQEYRRTYMKSTGTWSDWKGIGLNSISLENEIIG